MDRETLNALIEAVLLTARGPVDADSISLATEREVGEGAIEEILKEMAAQWDEADRGVRLERSAGGWRCITPAQLDHYLRTFHGINSHQKLSQAALEVLALVAHRQPVTLPEINFIRGTNSSAVTRTRFSTLSSRWAQTSSISRRPTLGRRQTRERR